MLASLFVNLPSVKVRDRIWKASLKPLGTVGWRDIEIRGGEAGRPTLLLHGAAATTSAALGLTQCLVRVGAALRLAPDPYAGGDASAGECLEKTAMLASSRSKRGWPDAFCKSTIFRAVASSC